jgi:hypothetical protein
VAGIEPHVAMSWITNDASDEVVADVPPPAHLAAIGPRRLPSASRSVRPRGSHS